MLLRQAEVNVLKDGEVLEVRLDAPSQPGPCRLVVRPRGGPPGPPTIYPLEIAPGASISPSSR
jgi:hypothetical protein